MHDETGCLEVIATTGDAKLGGDDWDRAFLQWVLQHTPGDARSAHILWPPLEKKTLLILITPRPSLRSRLTTHLGTLLWLLVSPHWRQQRECACSCASASDMRKLLRAVESAKNCLSEREQTSISSPSFWGGRGLDVSVTRRDFEEATAPLLSRLWPPLKELGAQACLSWASR